MLSRQVGSRTHRCSIAHWGRPDCVADGQGASLALVCFATPPPPSQRGEGVRGREEDSASSRAMTFISQNLSVLYPLSPSSPLRLSAERTIPPPYPLPSLQERRGSPATSFLSQSPHCLLRIRIRVYNPCPFITGASYLSHGFLYSSKYPSPPLSVVQIISN